MDTPIVIAAVRHQGRFLVITPPIECQPTPPTDGLPLWRAWVDLLETSVAAPSRALLPLAIEMAVVDAWSHLAGDAPADDASPYVTRRDQHRAAVLRERLHDAAA